MRRREAAAQAVRIECARFLRSSSVAPFLRVNPLPPSSPLSLAQRDLDRHGNVGRLLPGAEHTLRRALKI